MSADLREGKRHNRIQTFALFKHIVLVFLFNISFNILKKDLHEIKKTVFDCFSKYLVIDKLIHDCLKAR